MFAKTVGFLIFLTGCSGFLSSPSACHNSSASICLDGLTLAEQAYVLRVADLMPTDYERGVKVFLHRASKDVRLIYAERYGVDWCVTGFVDFAVMTLDAVPWALAHEFLHIDKANDGIPQTGSDHEAMGWTLDDWLFVDDVTTKSEHFLPYEQDLTCNRKQQ